MRPSVLVVLATARTFTLDGIAARPVRVEVDVHRGLPNFTIVGLPDAAVREARERVRAALVNCGFEFPLRRIVVNLAPASLRKAGPGMDLAIAAALLSASEQLEWEGLAKAALVGELALDGSTRPVHGALAMAEAAREGGAEAIVLPEENGPEAALAEGIGVAPVSSLDQLLGLAAGDWSPPRPEPLPLLPSVSAVAPDLADLRGQPHLRHALEVAAAGGHSLLMMGEPGSGKSMLAQRFAGLLPAMSIDEALESAAVASLGGRFATQRWMTRPTSSPHHTSSAVALVGGGSPPRPGEISRAHHGVLFLDEFPEFARSALEALREPLETGTITISRAARSAEFPARFQLIAAMNPCPCGYLGSASKACRCTPDQVSRYQGKLSGPLLDRIDLHIEVPAVSAQLLLDAPAGESTESIRGRVIGARERAMQRQGYANQSLQGVAIDRQHPHPRGRRARIRAAAPGQPQSGAAGRRHRQARRAG